MSLITDNSPFALGLDVGKAEVHAAVLSVTDPAFLAEKVFTNDTAGHQALLACLAAVLPPTAAIYACMEFLAEIKHMFSGLDKPPAFDGLPSN